MSQLDFNFDAASQQRKFKDPDVLDRQIEDVLEKLGLGDADWDDATDNRFLFWLHIHVLQDTVNVISDKRSGKTMKREAAEWLFSDATCGFSFFSIARILGSDPGELLSKIMEMPNIRNGLNGIFH